MSSFRLAPRLLIAAFAAWGLSAMAGCEGDEPPPGGILVAASSVSSTTGATGGGGGGEAGGGVGGSPSAGGGGAMTAVEDCFNGEDDDLDGATDCAGGDPDCATVCDDPCAAPKVLADPGSFSGDTTSFSAVEGTSCVAPAGGGATSVFEITAAHSGVMEIFLNGATADFTLSARSMCSAAQSEMGCSEAVSQSAFDEHLELAVTQGETLYILVEGKSALEAGAYTLVAESHVVDCGDGAVDSPEECDDGNDTDGDGCESCVFAPSESEPNNTFATAEAWSDPWYSQIDPIGDIDVFTITIPGDHYSIIASTFDLGNGACAMNQLDSQIFIALPDTTVVASDDDSGAGLCARAMARNLSAGTLYVRVQAPGLNQSAFIYKLALEIDPCGNGIVAAAEDCDDGNTTSGDGCSASCTSE